MVRKSKEAVEEEVEDVETEEETPSKGSVTVSWRGNTRVYSKEVHGKDFKALAKEFADKKGGVVA